MDFEEVINYIRQSYEKQIEALEEKYRAIIEAKNREIDNYQEEIKYLRRVNINLSERKIINNNRNIQIDRGNYNELIQGNYIQGDYLDMSQDLSQADTKIQELLNQLEQTYGISSEDAQLQVAKDLVNQAKTNSRIKSNLINWGKYLGDNVAKATISKAVKGVIKLALYLL